MKQLTEVQAHNLCIKGIEAFQKAEAGLLYAASVLYMVRETKAYEQEYGSWYAYTDEIKQYSAGTISKMIQVWEKFIVELKVEVKEVEKLGIYKAYDILKKRKPETKEQAIAVFQELELHPESNSRSIIANPDCKCEDTYQITFSQCRGCGKRTLIKSTE